MPLVQRVTSVGDLKLSKLAYEGKMNGTINADKFIHRFWTMKSHFCRLAIKSPQTNAQSRGKWYLNTLNEYRVFLPRNVWYRFRVQGRSESRSTTHIV